MTERVAADELRQFIERIEHMNAEIKDRQDLKKDIKAEAKARGYDTKAIDKLVTLRAMDPNEVSEQEAVFEMYREAVGV